MKASFKILLLSLLLATGLLPASGQTRPLSERMASTAMSLWKDSWASEPGKPEKWSYDHGVVLKGIEGVWYNTGDGKYFSHIQQSLDRFISADGTIRAYKLEEYNIDNVLLGRVLLMLYDVTGQEKYRKAASQLREQLKTHPRTSEGGFWHKKVYPYQMWLDGLYMGEPFYAEYAATFHEDAAFDDIAKQFILMERHSRDDKTGLLYHGWDESKKQRWANPQTGRSPNFWGRAMGWYAMALVDALEHFPENHQQRGELIAILRRTAAAIEKYQEPKSGLWWQVLDKGGAQGNYLESSASSMFVYALAKGVRLGYLPDSYLKVAQKGYQGIVSQFIEDGANGGVNLKGTVSVAGLGGNPYRDGSYEYYLSEKVVTNDPKGVGAFLLASNEIEMAAGRAVGKGKTVALDYYFNNEVKKDATGQAVAWHYKWEEMANGGFSLWGHVFRKYGVRTESLKEAPTAANLKGTDIYIIVDPDTPQETEHPNFVEGPAIKAISDWVKAGGVLVLMANDVGNAELDHFNQLAKEFGIQFNKDSKNRVQGNEFAMGKIVVPSAHPIFKTARELYLKEVSTINVTSPAKPALEHNGDVIVAVAKFGKGTVFAVGDPWLYNEYTDGRKLPAEYDNYKAATDLTQWLIQQVPSKRR
ncbi:MAG TPA: glycoside hydrolase family 88 protein [Bradyrhizobium sp.]|nr:glycoside hydrolase family 88 protein [Bradyrhizobium sp.]